MRFPTFIRGLVSMMTNLFQRTGLEQDTGRIDERWGQEGSVVVNTSDTFSADGTLYTVTTGKKFYVKTMVIQQNNSTSGQGALEDGVGTRRTMIRLGATTGQNVAVTFDTPLVFEDSVYVNVWGSASINVSLTGWEE